MVSNILQIGVQILILLAIAFQSYSNQLQIGGKVAEEDSQIPHPKGMGLAVPVATAFV